MQIYFDNIKVFNDLDDNAEHTNFFLENNYILVKMY